MNYALGLDIGGTQIKGALVDSSGAVLRTARMPTPLNLDALRTGLRTLIQDLVRQQAVSGVGVGCKGVIDPVTTRVECQPGVMNYLEGSVLSELAAVDVPVYADNDARLALVGECVWGAARGRRDVLMLTLGTGVGGGILSDGRMLRGHRGIAGHIGHLTTDPDGPLCLCGNRGCLETFFSARVIEAEAFFAKHRGLTTTLPQKASCEEVFAEAERGDAVARDIVTAGIRRLGAAIAGLLLVFDSEIVILGGQVARAGEMLFAPLRAEIAWRTRTLLRREVPIVPMQVDDPSGVVGAAALVFNHEHTTNIS
jgi:glucokinase